MTSWPTKFTYSSYLFIGYIMKVLKSLKSAKLRDKDCKVIKRYGKTFVINKKNPRLKARQG